LLQRAGEAVSTIARLAGHHRRESAAVAVTSKINFWADTLAKASVDELQVIRRSLLSRKDSSSDLVLMVQAEIERRERGFIKVPRVVEH